MNFTRKGLGDVIFADRLWSYDAGKIEKEDARDRFQGDMVHVSPGSCVGG
jgi:hypothetical protein